MRWHSPHLPLLLLILSALEAVMASGFKICAYNVQKLDSKKASNSRVAHTLTRVRLHTLILPLSHTHTDTHTVS